MARYRLLDGTVLDTSKATQHWEENTRWDGRNHISVATGSKWEHQTLYRSRKGRYYIEHCSDYQSVAPHAEWVSEQEAAGWLLANEQELPPDLASLEADIVE
jgi:hypothetical protein